MTTEVKHSPTITNTPEQYLAGEGVSKDLEYKLGRACTAQCFSVIRGRLLPGQEPTVQELIDFVVEYGAGTGSDLYQEGQGWKIIGLADLLRLEGISAVSQNLVMDPSKFNLDLASKSGRARTDFEKSMLVMYKNYSGHNPEGWLGAIDHTLQLGGQVISSISIPLLSGGFGPHSVIIERIDRDEGTLTYFDGDYYNLQRYGSEQPRIERVSQTDLVYRRPITDHLQAMTGEVVHIFG